MKNFKEFIELTDLNEIKFNIAKKIYQIIYEDINSDDEDEEETDEDISPEQEEEKETDTDEKKADVWYKQLEDKVDNPGKSTGLSNYKRSNTVMLGRMYAYRYDPKYKSKLKFYDENPLTIAFEHKQTSGGTGFLGINLHFIPRQQRGSVIKYFVEKNKVNVMKQGEIDIDYEKDLKNNTKFRYIYSCIRHYLLSQVIGSFIMIPQEDYVNVINLYSAKYVGMSEYEIMNIIKNEGNKNLLNTPGIQNVKKKKDDANKKRRDALKKKREAEKISGIENNISKPKKFDVIQKKPKEEVEKFNGNL